MLTELLLEPADLVFMVGLALGFTLGVSVPVALPAQAQPNFRHCT
jgi:hypothetical protein